MSIILLVLSREWMGMGVAGMIIDSYCGSFPHSLRLAPVGHFIMILTVAKPQVLTL